MSFKKIERSFGSLVYIVAAVSFLVVYMAFAVLTCAADLYLLPCSQVDCTDQPDQDCGEAGHDGETCFSAIFGYYCADDDEFDGVCVCSPGKYNDAECPDPDCHQRPLGPQSDHGCEATIFHPKVCEAQCAKVCLDAQGCCFKNDSYWLELMGGDCVSDNACTCSGDCDFGGECIANDPSNCSCHGHFYDPPVKEEVFFIDCEQCPLTLHQ